MPVEEKEDNIKREFFCLAALSGLILTSEGFGESSYYGSHRAQWVNNGLIIGGGGQEAYIFRVRRGGPSLRTDAWESFLEEHTEEYVIRYKNMGHDVFHTHGYKGFGYQAERPEMEMLKGLSKLVHKHGMKLSTYCQIMTLVPETFFAEEPRAVEWVQRDAFGQPVMLNYGFQQAFRYKPNIAHPEYRRYYKEKIIKTLVQDCGTDMLHCDNFESNREPESDHSPVTVEAFRSYLRNKYTKEQLIERFGHANIDYINPPIWNRENDPWKIEVIGDPVLQEWIDFRCWLHADFLREITEYAKSLNPEVAFHTNPHGIFGTNRAYQVGLWHPWFLKYTEAMISEERNLSDYNEKGILISKIRTFKMGRTLNNYIIFNVNNDRTMAENLAFNQTIGRTALHRRSPDKALSRIKQHYVDFYRAYRDLYTGTQPREDVAVLRSYPSMAYYHHRAELEVSMVEQALIQSQIPFAIIFDEQMDDLARYKVLVLAGQNNLPDEHVERIRRFVQDGGGLVATGASSFFDRWGRSRPCPALSDILGLEAEWHLHSGQDLLRPASILKKQERGRVVYLPEVIPPDRDEAANWKGSWDAKWILPVNWEEIAGAVRRAAGGEFSVEVEAPDWVAVEQMEQERMILVHLVNYKKGNVLTDLSVDVALNPGTGVNQVRLVSPDMKAEKKLPFQVEENRCRFVVSKLEIYSIGVIELVPCITYSFG